MTYQTVYLPTTDRPTMTKGDEARGCKNDNAQSHRTAHTGSLLLALFRIHVLVPCAALCGHASPLRGGRVLRVRVLRLILRISRETFPGSDQGRRAYLILKPILVVVIVVIDILKIVIILEVLKFESATGEVVDRTGDDLV